MDDLVEEKKRAEVESDEAWFHLEAAMEMFNDGDLMLKTLYASYQNFKLSHNTERGLRHE